jgi:hypothetical protein
MSRHTTAKAKQGDKELTVQQHETDSPILPVAQLHELHEFRPDAVDWVLDQSKTEADFRRSESHRINGFVLVEKILGQIFAFTMGLSGIIGGVYAAVHGQPTAGTTIASFAITVLAVVFLTGKKQKS